MESLTDCVPVQANLSVSEIDWNMCGGRGSICVQPTGGLRCLCMSGYTGFAEFNMLVDNCDVFKPVLYFLGSLVLLVDISMLYVVYRAIQKWSVAKFFQLLWKRNAPAAIALSGIMVAVLQIIWVSVRLSDLDSKIIGQDPVVTVCFGLSIFFIYVTAPHVLRHYAKLTFSESRMMMLNMVGREKAKSRAVWVRPLVVLFLPACAIVAGVGPMVSINNPSLIKTGLQIMSGATGVFLFFTLILIQVLISPMVRDMKLAVSLNRLSPSDQDTLFVATQKLIIFQFIITSISVLYLPIMLVWGFLPSLRGSVTYVYFLGALFCGIICVFSVFTLANVFSSQNAGISVFKRGLAKQNKGKAGVEVVVAEVTSTPPPKAVT